ncbi:sugar ABC transporter ATP-binding protein, partial [Bacillus cereus]
KARLEVYETIKKMKREGLAILLISSDVEEIIQLVNRVYVMRNGRFVSYMEKEQLSVNEVTRLAYGGVTE